MYPERPGCVSEALDRRNLASIRDVHTSPMYFVIRPRNALPAAPSCCSYPTAPVRTPSCN